MSESHSAHLAHHFDDAEQQREAASLGMWVFLVTEIMFFGGLFAGYTVYRSAFPQAFAEASHHLDVLLGGINTAVLITSSFMMVMAVHSAQIGNRKLLMAFLALTMLFGLIFLTIKGTEYFHKFKEGLVPGPLFTYEGAYAQQVQLFLGFYFAMTGVHALHMVIGIGILTVLLIQAWQGKFSAEYNSPVDVAGLYWHFVDIIWIFLFPLLYLVGYHLGHH